MRTRLWDDATTRVSGSFTYLDYVYLDRIWQVYGNNQYVISRTRDIASATSLFASHQEQHTRVTMRVSLAYSKFKHALSMPCSKIQAIFGM